MTRANSTQPFCKNPECIYRELQLRLKLDINDTLNVQVYIQMISAERDQTGVKHRVVELHTEWGLCIVSLRAKQKLFTTKVMISIWFQLVEYLNIGGERLCGWVLLYTADREWIIQKNINYSEINRLPSSEAPQVGWKKISRCSLSSRVKMASDQ